MLSIFKMNIITLIFLINIIYLSYTINAEPCDILDTVNITGSMKFPNGSYLHDGIIYPSNLVGTYNYIPINLNQTPYHPIDSHLRGCICKIRSCVNICCPKNQYFNRTLDKCLDQNGQLNTDMELLRNDKSFVTIDLYQTFKVVTVQPCTAAFVLEPEKYPEDKWVIHENGAITLTSINKSYSRNEYCFQRLRLKNDTYNTLHPFVCASVYTHSTTDHIYSIALFISLPFLIITILVYSLLPELRNLHGKSFVCYLIGLTVGNVLLGLNNIRSYDHATCIFVGYTTYFFYMASFFWLSVISFYLWTSFHNTKTGGIQNELKTFLLYSLYAWGLAALFLVIVIVAQNSNIPKHLKPGIDGTICFLNSELWIQLAYFQGPILLIIIFNLIMFIMTALKIYKVQQEISRTMSRDGNKRNLHEEKDRFGLFLRLFIIMGITWLMEIISWFAGPDYKVIFYITDMCNALQGLVIFILFVLKKRVKNLILKRYFRGTKTPSTRTDSSNTTTTNTHVEGNDIHLGTRMSKN